MDSSLPDSWCPGRQLIGTLNAHTLLQLESEVRGMAHKKHGHPERQSSRTGGFLLVAAMKGPMSAYQYKQIGIRGGARY
jgi:hypothetical protein